MSNIVINDLEHNIELDRKSLIELKGGYGWYGRQYGRDRGRKKVNTPHPGLLNGQSSLRRGPHKGPISDFIDRYGNPSATSSSTSSAIG